MQEEGNRPGDEGRQSYYRKDKQNKSKKRELVKEKRNVCVKSLVTSAALVRLQFPPRVLCSDGMNRTASQAKEKPTKNDRGGGGKQASKAAAAVPEWTWGARSLAREPRTRQRAAAAAVGR